MQYKYTSTHKEVAMFCRSSAWYSLSTLQRPLLGIIVAWSRGWWHSAPGRVAAKHASSSIRSKVADDHDSAALSVASLAGASPCAAARCTLHIARQTRGKFIPVLAAHNKNAIIINRRFCTGRNILTNPYIPIYISS